MHPSLCLLASVFLCFSCATVPLTLAESLEAPTSAPISAPISATVNFTAPEELLIGVPFLAHCHVSLQGTFDYNVTYTLNGTDLGKYIVKQVNSGPLIHWETVSLVSGLNVYQHRAGDSSPPQYDALFSPLTTASNGLYACTLTVAVPGGGLAQFTSPTWDALDITGKPSIPPTVRIAYGNSPPVGELKEGLNFAGICTLNMSPSVVNYAVTFIVDSSSTVQYIVKGAHQAVPTVHMRMLGSAYNVNTFRGPVDTKLKIFTVLMQPTYNTSINTRFHCYVNVEIPLGGKATYNSKEVCTLPKYC